MRLCCPRCGAQTLSPHECHPPERELHGGAPVEVRLELPPTVETPEVVYDVGEWTHWGGSTYRREYLGFTLEVQMKSLDWGWKINRLADPSLSAGVVKWGSEAVLNHAQFAALEAAREVANEARDDCESGESR